MANNLQTPSERFVNRSGAALTINSLIALEGFDEQNNDQMAVFAQANGTNRRADLFIDKQHNNNRSATGFKEFIVEGTVANPVNTAGSVVGAPIFLSPTVPGGWTPTRPTAANQDVQEIGSVMTVNAVTGRVRFNLSAGGVSGTGPGTITSSSLSDQPDIDIGQASSGYVRISAAITDGDRWAINGRIYEYDTAAPPGALGAGADIRIGVSGGGGDSANTAAGCATATAAAINGDASAVTEALVLGGTGIVGISSIVTGIVAADQDFTLVDTVDAGGVLFPSAATLLGSQPPTVTQRLSRRYDITAENITAMALVLGTSEIVIGVFPSTSTPLLHAVSVLRVNGVGFAHVDIQGVRFRVQQVNAHFWQVTLAQNPLGAILVASDVVIFTLERQV